MDHKLHVDKIREAIDYGRAGYRDDQALATIRREVAAILADPALHPSRTAGKLPEILTWADVYFSPRKHQRYQGGLQQVYLWMMEALDSVPSTPPQEDSPKK
jgi:hypothetical protein